MLCGVVSSSPSELLHRFAGEAANYAAQASARAQNGAEAVTRQGVKYLRELKQQRAKKSGFACGKTYSVASTTSFVS